MRNSCSRNYEVITAKMSHVPFDAKKKEITVEFLDDMYILFSQFSIRIYNYNFI